MFDQSGDVLDPHAAELIVRSALGEPGLAANLPGATIAQAQVAIVSLLAHQGKLGDPDAFMGEVQKLLDEWSE